MCMYILKKLSYILLFVLFFTGASTQAAALTPVAHTAALSYSVPQNAHSEADQQKIENNNKKEKEKCGDGVYDYTSVCVLPPFRWGPEQHMIYDDSGWLGAIASIPAAIGSLLIMISSFIFMGLMFVTRFGVDIGNGIWTWLGGFLASITAMLGGALAPLSIALMVFTLIRNIKKAFKGSNILTALFRSSVTWLIPFSVLLVLVSSSQTAIKTPPSGGAHTQVGTAAWFGLTIDGATAKVAGTFTALDFTMELTDPKVELKWTCDAYIQGIHDKYLKEATADSKGTMVALSNLWVNTQYSNVVRAQFGSQSGDEDYPGLVGCHAMEDWNRVSVAEQHRAANTPHGGKDVWKEKAGIFGPHSREGGGQFIRAMIGWAACAPGEPGEKAIREAFKVQERKKLIANCETVNTDKKISNAGNEGADNGMDDFYIFGKDMMSKLLNNEGSPTEEQINKVEPAADLGNAMSGRGMSRLVYGFMGLLSAIVSMFVLGPMALGLLIAVLMSVFLVAFALPLALVLLAGGYSKLATRILRMIMSSLVSKALFTILLAVIVAVIQMFNQVVKIIDTKLAFNRLPSIIEAILYGGAPLLAFFVVNMLLKKLVPNANFMNPVSMATLATKGVLKASEGKPELDKDGNPKPKKPGLYSRYKDRNPNSLAAQAHDRLNKADRSVGQRTRIPTGRVKKWARRKTGRPAASDRELNKALDQDAKDQKDAEAQKQKDARRQAAELLADTGQLPEVDKDGKIKLDKDGKIIPKGGKAKEKEKSHDEGLNKKSGAPLDPEAVQEGAAKDPIPHEESKNSPEDNAKEYKDAIELRIHNEMTKAAAAGTSTGDAAHDRAEAMIRIHEADSGPILDENARTALKAQVLQSDDPAFIAKWAICTDNGRVINTQRPLVDMESLKGLSRDELYARFRDGAGGLSDEDLAPKLKLDGTMETEVEHAARIETIKLERGLTDIDGNDVNQLKVIGVTADEVYQYVQTGKSGDAATDEKLRKLAAGQCAEFDSKDSKHEAQAVQVAVEATRRRTDSVENVGFTVANLQIRDREINAIMSTPEYRISVEASNLEASRLALREPDVAKVVEGIKAMVESQLGALRPGMDPATFDALLSKALDDTVREVMQNATKSASAGEAGAVNPQMLDMLKSLLGATDLVNANVANLNTRAPSPVIDSLTMDNLVTQFTVSTENNKRYVANYAALTDASSPEDRNKAARAIAHGEAETIVNLENVVRAYETIRIQAHTEAANAEFATGRYTEEKIHQEWTQTVTKAISEDVSKFQNLGAEVNDPLTTPERRAEIAVEMSTMANSAPISAAWNPLKASTRRVDHRYSSPFPPA